VTEKLFFDTSVLLAALVLEHPQHGAAEPLLNDVLGDRRRQAVLSAHGLTEVYSVLTRAPAPLLIYPSDAWQMLESGLLPHVQLVSLTAAECRETVAECARRNWAGERVYDAIDIRAAEKAGCRRLYTFNVKHFRDLAPASWRDKIVSP
jgi:predicted nucleic acid-binding protein